MLAAAAALRELSVEEIDFVVKMIYAEKSQPAAPVKKQRKPRKQRPALGSSPVGDAPSGS